MAFELNETASITLRIEGDKARNELALLESEAKKLERTLKETPKGTKEWADLYKEIGKNEDAQKALRKELGLTGMTFGQLEKEAKTITKEMKGMAEGTAEYAAKSARLKEVNARLAELRQDYRAASDEGKKFSASIDDWNDASKRATLTTRQLKDIVAQLQEEIQDLVPGTREHAAATAKLDEVNKQVNTTLKDQPSRWKQAQTAVVAFVGAFSLMSVVEEFFGFIKQGITDAIGLSDAMSDVEKSTKMTTPQVAALSEELDQLDTRTAKEGLMDIAKVGGQLGVANDELLGFVKSVDMAVVALGDEFSGGAEEASKEIGALQKLFKETKDMKAGDAINDIGSALNELGADGSATAPVIADFTQRIGQLGDLSPQISETMGLGAAFQELGLSAEISAGGLTNILMGAAKATDLFAQQLGITEVEMKQLINTNPNEFLLKLAESLRGLPTDQVNKRLDDLGIKSQEATKVMSLLKDQTQMVRDKQLLANKAMQDGTSLLQEFKVKNSNAAAELEKTKKGVTALATDIGLSLLPYLTKAGQTLLTFVGIIRAVPEFVNENKVSLIALGIALVTFNAQSIAAAASTLRLAAAEKIATIQKGASAVAQRLLNTAMSMNPIGAVITVIMLLVAAFVALYNNSLTVRAGVNGLFTAMKVAASELLRFWEALTSLNFAEAATIMVEGGKKIAQGFTKGYQETMTEGQQKVLTAHKKHVDDKKTASVAGAKTTGDLEVLEDQKTLDRKKEAAKKHQEEQAKDNAELIKKTRDAKIEAIKDETDRERAKLKAKRDDEVAAIQASTADERQKNEAIRALDAQLKVDLQRVNQAHVDKVREDQQKALDLYRDYQISLESDEKRRKELDAQFRYEKEKTRIQKEITDEGQRATTLTALEAKLKADLSQINDEFRAKEREANNALRQQEQAAEIALLNLKELEAGNNAQKLLAIKRQRLDTELAHYRTNLRAERDEELARIEHSNLSQDQKAAAQKAINDKYLADVGTTIRQHTADMTALDQQAIAERKARYEAFSSAFKSLLNGDLMAFAKHSANIVKGEKAAWQERLTENMDKYDMVADIAKASVDFLNKKTQERLDKEIAASKKETEQKLSDAEKRKEAAIKAAEEQAEKEKLAAGDSAEKIKEIETKLAESKADIRTQFEDEADAIRQDGAVKEKELARKKWEADKKAQVATAIISGAQAALKALASGIFPVNLVFAGIIAGLTAYQVAKIRNQPAPQFRQGGAGQIGSDGGSYSDYVGNLFKRGGRQSGGAGHFKNAGILRGGRHGSRYGERGIAMIDRQSGREVGEAEDGEPFMILSRNTYANNKGVVDKLLYSSLYRNGQRITYANGGVGSSGWKGIGTLPPDEPYFGGKRMMLFGAKKKKREAEEAARQAEAEARKAEAEANAAMSSVYDGPTSGDEGDANGTGAAGELSGEAKAQAEEAAKMAQEQLDLLEQIGEAVEKGALNTYDALQLLTLEVKQGLYKVELTTSTALEKLDQNLQTALEAHGLAITAELKNLDTGTGSSLDTLGTDLTEGLLKMTDALETALSDLGKLTETKVDDLQKETVLTLKDLETTTKESIEEFQKATIDQLEVLTKTTDESVDELQDELIKALDDLGLKTETAIDELRTDAIDELRELAKTTDTALDELQTETVDNLKALATQTETALDKLASETKSGLDGMGTEVRGLKGSINAVEGAVRSVVGATKGVEGAIYGTNQAGRLDALIDAISKMK